jgi:membrane fusion protein, multidrug efflux system
VPQQAVRRNDAGEGEVFVVRNDNRAALTPVRLGHAIGDRWLILDGVEPGDRIIVDGFQKFIAGDVVRPKLWSASGRAQEPSRTGSVAPVTSPN